MNQEHTNASRNDDTAGLAGLVTGPFRFSSYQRPSSMWPDFLSGQAESPVRVVVVGDRTHVHSVIAPELMSDRRTVLVGQGDTLREGRAMLRDVEFDVLLVNVKLPDGSGFELIPYSKKIRPNAEVVALSSVEDDEDALRAFELGAAGYLVKNSWFDNFVQAVLQVANGGASVTPTLARRLLLRGDRSKPTLANGFAVNASSPGKLSEREREVLRMVANGMTSSEIGTRLTISQMTVNTHIKHIYHKLQARTRAQAVQRASDWGVL